MSDKDCCGYEKLKEALMKIYKLTKVVLEPDFVGGGANQMSH